MGDEALNVNSDDAAAGDERDSSAILLDTLLDEITFESGSAITASSPSVRWASIGGAFRDLPWPLDDWAVGAAADFFGARFDNFGGI